MLKHLFLIFTMLAVAIFAQAQSAEISGKVTDDKGEPVPFANVSTLVNGSLIGAQTDFDGFYSIKPLPAGSYELTISYVGFEKQIISGVIVNSDRITPLDVTLTTQSEVLKTVEIKAYKVPLIQSDVTSTGGTVTKEDIANLPTKNIASIASQTAGVYQKDEGKGINIKGSRENASDYYIDGIKVRGSTGIPTASIEQLTVVTGGVPARYGDATGGIINITTRGPSSTFAGGIELETSKFLDAFGYYFVGASVSGPIIKINKGTDKERSLLGFFISGQYQRNEDDSPSSQPIWRAKDDVLKELKEHPLINAGGESGILQAVEFVDKSGLEKYKTKINIERNNVSVAGKVDFQPVTGINFTVGGNYSFANGGYAGRGSGTKDLMRRYQLFNNEHMPEINNSVYRVYGRITQRFGNAKLVEGEQKKSSSPFQNAYYSLQFDYTQNNGKAQDPVFKDRLFEYGHVGSFTVDKKASYPIDALNIIDKLGREITLTGHVFNGDIDTLVHYTPGTANPILAQYDSEYFKLAGDNYQKYYKDFASITGNSGLLNGNTSSSLSSSYSLYYLPGTTYNLYQTSNANQYRLTFNGSFDLKKQGASEKNKHAIEFGVEYEQIIDRNWSVSPVGLWDLMDAKISQPGRDIILDRSSAVLLIDGKKIPIQEYDGVNQVFGDNDTITFSYVRPEGSTQSFFDKQYRKKFGYGDLEFAQVQATDPAKLSLDLFSPDELVNNGTGSIINYYGYDYLGKKQKKQPAFRDYWTEKVNIDGLDIYTRPVGAFRPIYMAGFIQDKFSFKDLIFNVGVRVDRYDANLKTPKDLYNPIYGSKKVGDILNESNNLILSSDTLARPATIGKDYVVYVNSANDPTKITGFRSGDQWYTRNGAAVSDPRALKDAGGIIPYLVGTLNETSPDYDPSFAFADYKPQINVVPRISFSFELSDEAIFFAHYDVLTQRPQDNRNFTTPDDYYYFQTLDGTKLNSNLKAERTIDYQIGFKQKISQSSAINLSAFYKELKDMLQIYRVNYAYPIDYTTFSNIDFGTVKGLEVSYDMRRTQNLRLTLGYTLQFAEGTGSGDQSQANLVSFGIPNLRTVLPFDYDSRHMLNLNVDYSFDSGKDYNGPKLFGKDILANFGVNLLLRARSGEPYSQQLNATTEAKFGVPTRPELDGSVNGSRLSWNFKADMRIEKGFALNFGKKEGKSARLVNVYLSIQNLLNTKNINSVYRYTGTPNDDGYLTSTDGITDIKESASSKAFEDQYRIFINNPDNFSLPRTIHLGLSLNLD